MAATRWMWLAARFEPEDALFRTEFSEEMTREAATALVVSLLSELPNSDRFVHRVVAGPRAGQRDVTVTVPGPDGLVILALVDLGDRSPQQSADRSPQQSADRWAQEMAAAMRAQGVDAQIAIRPGS